jgi:peroxiredoxin
MVVGVSHDSIARLNDFSADPHYCAGKFPVASDPDGAIARSYGLEVTDAQPGAKDTRGQPIDHAFTERTTFVIAPGGKIAGVFSVRRRQDRPVRSRGEVARRRAEARQAEEAG